MTWDNEMSKNALIARFLQVLQKVLKVVIHPSTNQSFKKFLNQGRKSELHHVYA